MSDDEAQLDRPARKRRRRRRKFIEAAQLIIADEGFDALTMSRLADELDTAVSAVYRYFPSKGALVAEVQREAIQTLAESLARANERVEQTFADQGLEEPVTAVCRLVLVGRWLCATADTYPEELRFLQLIMSRRETALDPDGGERIFPVAMEVLGSAVEAIEAAQRCGAITPANSVERAVILASGLSGVLQTDDLEKYAPELFGRARLARQAHLDILAGWGADPDVLAEASALVDQMADQAPLAS